MIWIKFILQVCFSDIEHLNNSSFKKKLATNNLYVRILKKLASTMAWWFPCNFQGRIFWSVETLWQYNSVYSTQTKNNWNPSDVQIYSVSFTIYQTITLVRFLQGWYCLSLYETAGFLAISFHSSHRSIPDQHQCKHIFIPPHLTDTKDLIPQTAQNQNHSQDEITRSNNNESGSIVQNYTLIYTHRMQCPLHEMVSEKHSVTTHPLCPSARFVW